MVEYLHFPIPVFIVASLQQLFGNVIKARRERIKLSQEKLADIAGLHRTYISLLERGKRMPSIDVVRKLAVALETTMASLMRSLEKAIDEEM